MDGQTLSYSPQLFELAQRFKALSFGATALFASSNIMSCLEKCPYYHRKANLMLKNEFFKPNLNNTDRGMKIVSLNRARKKSLFF